MTRTGVLVLAALSRPSPVPPRWDIDRQPVQPAGATFTPDDRNVVFSRLRAVNDAGLYLISLDDVVAGAAFENATRMASLGNAEEASFWGFSSPFGWTETDLLVGLVGFNRVARVSFTFE